MGADVLKEYLVSLGYKDDISSQLQSALKSADGNVSKFAKGTTAEFLKAGAAVTAFVVTATVGIGKFLGRLAKSDLEMQKYARSMWTSNENAKALKTTLDAMGVTLQDLWLSPELRKQFLELRQIAKELIPPNEYREQMKYIRSIGLEFTKMKLEFTYASQWIGYYLIKYIQKPLSDFHKHLQDINKAIQVNMPAWTKRIAEVLSWFIRLGDTLWRLGEVFFDILSRVGTKTVALIALFSGVGKLIMSGPFGMFLALFGGILLVVEDFFTYMDGGKSALADLWKQLGDRKTLLEFRDNIVSVAKSFGELLRNVIQLFVKIVSSKTVFDGVIAFLDTINILVTGIATAISGISTELERLDKLGLKEYTKELPGRINDYSLNNPMGLGGGYAKDQPGAGGYGNITNAPVFNITTAEPFGIISQIKAGQKESVDTLIRQFQGGR